MKRLQATAETRLDKLFEPLAWLLMPQGAGIFCIIGWLSTALLCGQMLGMLYLWIGIGLVLASIQIEKRLLTNVPFPPLTTIILSLRLKCVIGGFLILVSSQQGVDEVFKEQTAEALPLVLIPSFFIVSIGGVLNYKFCNKNNTLPLTQKQDLDDEKFRRIILLVTLITGFIAISYILVGTFSGSLDRGEGYLRWVGRFWRPDTVLSALIRLRDIFYVVLPLAILQNRKSKLVLGILIIPTIASLMISASLGGRGLIIYPFILIVGGLWLAGINSKWMKILVILLSIGGLVFSITMAQIRSSGHFTNSSAFDISSRVKAVQEAVTLATTGHGFSLGHLGENLYTHSDPYLFVDPAKSKPPAGTKRLSNLMYLWVPRVVMVDRPEVNDGHLIASEIRDNQNYGVVDGRYTSFWNVSFGADLYWRFRWAGVVTGSILFGLFYGLACRAWYKYAALNGGPFAILIALFPATFLQGPPLRSVSETAWNWLYEFPKYLIVLFVVALVIRSLVIKKKQQLS